MVDRFYIVPIGIIKKEDDTCIDIHKEYEAALLGLEGFSHINVLYWFHENDTPENRKILQVYPRRDQRNPLTGVFATHSPVRPNLIALTRGKILSIDGCRIRIDHIDARDGSPVIDIKCYIPDTNENRDVQLPEWV